jgi:glutamine synthetase
MHAFKRLHHLADPLLQGLLFNEMRSKTKCMMQPIESLNPADFPDWSYDGSSTGQAKGNNSDCIVK